MKLFSILKIISETINIKNTKLVIADEIRSTSG